MADGDITTQDDEEYSGFKPRSYQIEIYELAKEANIIVKLNTGAGKTFIAVMLIKYNLWKTDSLLEDGGKRIVFLVKNVHLVRQQAAAIRKHLPFPDAEKAVGEYYGQIKPGEWVDLWSKDTWQKVFNSHRVVVITAGVFKDIINHAKFSLDQVCLLIFDECHHTSKDDDYNHICRHLIPYTLARSKKRPKDSEDQKRFIEEEAGDIGPRVLGLTACVVNGNVRPNKVVDFVVDLEWSMGCRLVTSSETQSLSFAQDTVEEMVEYRANSLQQDQMCIDMLSCFETGLSLLESLSGSLPGSPNKMRGKKGSKGGAMDGSSALYDLESNLTQKVKRSLSDGRFVLEELGPWCCDQVITDYIQDLTSAKTRCLQKVSKDCIDAGIKCLIEAHTHFEASSKPDLLPRVSDKCLQLAKVLFDYYTDQKQLDSPASPPPANFTFSSAYNIPQPDSDWIHSESDVPLSSIQPLSLHSRFDASADTSSEASSTDSSEEEESERDDRFRAVVFVQQRQFAYALSRYLDFMSRQCRQLNFLRVDYVTGCNVSSLQSKEIAMSLSKQDKILNDFRKGSLNLLIATRVIEEGMDVQECNLVIKMDPPEEFRSYVQSKGRARASKSRYVIMVPDTKRNESQYKLDLYKGIEASLVAAIKDRTVDFSEDEVNDQLSTTLNDQPEYMPFGKTGPRITLNSACSVIGRYVSRLRQDSILPLRTHYYCEPCPGGFTGHITLPMPCPLRQIIQGPMSSNKRLAKQLAALEVCKLLHENGELNNDLLPVDTSLLDDLDIDDEEDDISTGAGLMGTKKKRRVYDLGFARLLTQHHLQPIDAEHHLHLYALNIHPAPHDMINLAGNGFTHTDLGLGLIVTQPLCESDDLAHFPLFYEAGRSSVQIRFLHRFTASSGGVDQLLTCHRNLMEVVLLQKQTSIRGELSFDPENSKMPAIVAIVDSKRESVDWLMTHKICEAGSQRKNLLDVDPSLWRGSLIQPFHSSIEHGLFLISDVSQQLTALSPFVDPEKASSYADYFAKRYKKSAIRSPESQPLVLVKRVSSLRNILLNQTAKTELTTSRIRRTNSNVQHFIPEFCMWVPVPASLWLHLSSLPFILYRLNQLLLMQQLHMQINSDLGLNMSLAFPLELDVTQVNFITPGKDYFVDLCSPDVESLSVTNLLEASTLINSRDLLNLERLEMLGDSFLKYIVSVFLHVNSHPLESEGRLSQKRQRVICNKNLFDLARSRGLCEYLFPRPLEPSNHTLPPSYRVLTKSTSMCTSQTISDKSIADHIEALIGCFIHYGNQAMALKLVLWLGIQLHQSDSSVKISFSDPLPPPPEPLLVVGLPDEEINSHLDTLCCGFDVLEDIIHYRFRRREFLLQALTHASCLDNRVTCCYQRLEFLGDAVLDYLVTVHIFKENKDMTPGKLTDLRSALVNNNLFAAIVVKFGIQKFLKHSDPVLFKLIGDFENFQTSRKHKLRSVEFASDSGEKVTLKVLGDLFESLAGAVYLDTGYSLSETWRVLKPLLSEPLEDFSRNVPINIIRQFYERFPRVQFGTPKFLTVTGLISLTASADGQEFTVTERSSRLCKRALAKKFMGKFAS